VLYKLDAFRIQIRRQLVLISFLKTDIKKAIRYIKDHGWVAFGKRIRAKLGSYQGEVTPLSDSPKIQEDMSGCQSIWDDSIEQYQKANFKLYWELLTEVEKYQMKSITGDENLHYFWYTFDYLKGSITATTNLRALSIGCMEGNPGPEMSLFKTGLFNEIDVMDIAEGLLKKQKKIASEMRLNSINYIRQDLNKVVLKKNAYDLIWAIGTIHHIENLEGFFEQINRAIKDDGIFMLREYVGPNRLQLTDVQLSIINEILSILPEKYKKTVYGSIKNIAKSPDIAELMTVDPSESVRSQDILSVMNEKLNVIKLVHTGGTILQPLLNNIASNFEEDQDADTILRLLIFFEKILIEKEILPSDYVFSIAKKLG